VNTERFCWTGSPASDLYEKLRLAGDTVSVGDPAGPIVPLNACELESAVGLVLSDTVNV
jgi:hypothetical protein